MVTPSKKQHMKKRTVSLLLAVVLSLTVQSQVTAPVLNAPRLTIPATFSGKLKLADSLQKLKTPAGVMLKAFLPQYTPQFQDQLIEALLVVDNAITIEDPADPGYWFFFRVNDLIQAVKTEYPTITRPVMYKVFYTLCYSRKPELFSWTWPWFLEESLNTSYGQNKSDLTAPKYLKQAGVPITTVFSYYAYKTTIITDPWISNKETMTADRDRYSIKTTVYNLLTGGYTPAEIYTSMRNGGYRSEIWVSGYCYANSLFATPVETVARILKADRITGDELGRILSQIPEYKKPENLLKAQQAN
jgi:hypothetical protein